MSKENILRVRDWGAGRLCRCFAACALSWPLLTLADGQQDRTIAGLKAATLDLMQAQAAAAEDRSRLSLHVGDRDQALLLDEMRVSIDGAPPLRYEYSDVEALALHQDGLHRLLAMKLAPGKHHFRADFAARYADSSPDHSRVAGTLERDIMIDAQPANIELQLVKGSYIGKPELQFHELKAVAGAPATPDSFAFGSNQDPRVRVAAFLTATDRPFAAAAELFKLQAQGGGASLPADFYRHLADALNSFGLSPRAQALHGGGDAVAAQGDDPATPAYSNYNRGIALMKDGHAAEGAALLEAIAAGKADDAESAALCDKANLVLGYAQLRQHTGANAVPLFSRVRSFGPYSSAALLGLGWALLAPSGNGQNAAPAGAPVDPQAPMRRIPVLLQPHLTDDIAVLKRREPYRLRPVSPQEEQSVRRALVPWVELRGRDPLDPAVQEGMIAIPYALNHIGAYEEARDDFQRAVKLLEAADAQLDAATQRVGGGQMIQALDSREAADKGWPWWLSAYPKEHWWLADDPREPMAAPDTFYLQQLKADDGFRAAMQDFHDLRLLSDALDHMEGVAAAASLRPRLLAATAAEATLLQDLAMAGLRKQKRHTEMYLGEARFALAHMNEPPPQGMSQ